MKGQGMLTVHFDSQRAEEEREKTSTNAQPATDYSSLPRVTKRSFLMGVLVSMGGMM